MINTKQLSTIKRVILDHCASKDSVAYIAGGVPRDLGIRNHFKDIDVVAQHMDRFLETLTNRLAIEKIEYKIHKQTHNISVTLRAPFQLTTSTSMNHILWFMEDVDIEISQYQKDEEITGGDRDFTINAMHIAIGEDTQDIFDDRQCVIKPYGAKISGAAIYDVDDPNMIVPVNDKSIASNPLRIFRAADLISRFGYEPSFALYRDCLEYTKTITPDNCPTGVRHAALQIINKMFSETYVIRRSVTEDVKPRNFINLIRALNFLAEINAWVIIDPQIQRMVETLHVSTWHNDTVWKHTMDVLKGIYQISQTYISSNYITSDAEVCLLWAAFLHDVGKPQCETVDPDGTTHYYGHQDAGVVIAQQILKELPLSFDQRKMITVLIQNHMVTKQFHEDEVKHKQYHILRRLLYDLGNEVTYTAWIVLNTADCWGSLRTTHSYPAQLPTMKALNDIRKNEIDWFKYEPVLTGAEIEGELHCDKRLIKCYLEQLLAVAMKNYSEVDTKEHAIHYIHTLGKEWKEAQLCAGAFMNLNGQIFYKDFPFAGKIKST